MTRDQAKALFMAAALSAGVVPTGKGKRRIERCPECRYPLGGNICRTIHATDPKLKRKLHLVKVEP